MQMVIKNRETLTGTTTVFSPAFDVSGYPLLTGACIVYVITGTSPTLDVTLQTSDDLETWDTLGTSFAQQNSAGVARQSWGASAEDYGRYVRAKMDTAGTDPLVNFSLYLNAFESS